MLTRFYLGKCAFPGPRPKAYRPLLTEPWRLESELGTVGVHMKRL